MFSNIMSIFTSLYTTFEPVNCSTHLECLPFRSSEACRHTVAVCAKHHEQLSAVGTIVNLFVLPTCDDSSEIFRVFVGHCPGIQYGVAAHVAKHFLSPSDACPGASQIYKILLSSSDITDLNLCRTRVLGFQLYQLQDAVYFLPGRKLFFLFLIFLMPL